MQTNKKSMFIFMPILTIAAFLSFFWSTQSISDEVITADLADNSDALPNFSMPGLMNTSKSFTHRTAIGQVYLLNIWASWCRYCFNEHEMLNKIKSTYHVPIYGIDYRDNPENARAYLADHGNPYTMVGVDWSGDVTTSLGINGTPQTYIVDKHGIIRYRYTGGIDQSAWDDVLLPIVKKYQNEK